VKKELISLYPDEETRNIRFNNLREQMKILNEEQVVLQGKIDLVAYEIRLLQTMDLLSRVEVGEIKPADFSQIIRRPEQ
jgi:hypothetical protein